MPGLIGLWRRDGQPISDDDLKGMKSAVDGAGLLRWEDSQSLPEGFALTRYARAQDSEEISKSVAPEAELYLLGTPLSRISASEKVASQFLKHDEKPHEGFFARLNGSFLAITCYNTPSRLQIVSDRTASRALYYLRTPQFLSFSTELKALLKTPGYQPKIDLQSVATFLGCGFLLEGKTLLQDVQVLGQGEYLDVNNETIELKRYWQHQFTPQRDSRPVEDLQEELGGLIQAAVERVTRAKSGLAVLLSGGYDSRTLLGSVRRLFPDRSIQTITWGESEEDPESDAGIARDLANRLKTQHTFYPLNAAALPQHFQDYVRQSEGRTDAVGNYPESLHIFERIRADLNVDCLIRGDECFGWKAGVRSDAEALHSMDVHDLKTLSANYPYLRPAWRTKLDELSSTQINRLLVNCPYEDIHDRKDYLYFTQRLPGYLHPLTQLKQRAVSICNPFLDAEILDFVSRLPSAWRVDKALFRQTSRRLFPDLQWERMAQHHNLIEWNQRITREAQLQRFIRQTLIEEANGIRLLIDQKALNSFLSQAFAPSVSRVRAVWKKVQRSLERNRGQYHLSPSTEIFRLMILKIWVDEYLGGRFEG